MRLSVANVLRQLPLQGQSYVDEAGRSDSVTRLDGSASLRLMLERSL
ncbi:hypothetical protein [Janthinobacterium sp. PAMC25594]|nr:hypothetical protein [Janthinobacterium sp. PAMC25594]QYG07298.1 hypothetical protein KY494_00215 [Janthinobacterium sp. PAMC25594]